jgi:glycosyltransferase involved in cell wall biosynthesis
VNVLFVSHCDFRGNSALHVLAVATEMHRRGHAPAIAVPDDPRTIDDLGRPPFPVLGFTEVERTPTVFGDGRGPDLVHAFTPREHVRRLTELAVSRHGCPYVVHLEDNEEVILGGTIGTDAVARLPELAPAAAAALVGPRLSHPLHTPDFIARAGGVTALLDTLLQFKPAGIPGAVFWPGFDEAVLSLPVDTDRIRSKLKVGRDDFVLVYTGNIHPSNVDEVRNLYLAVGLLRAAGHPVKLVKTGRNFVDMRWVRKAGLRGVVRDLGFVPRERVWDVVATADAFVQPGGPSPFNDFRFPSKLPDFLASGKPVVLPATNIGRYLEDGRDVLLLETGDAEEIAAAVSRLIADPALAAALGARGKQFALRELRWSRNVGAIRDLYDAVGRAA